MKIDFLFSGLKLNTIVQEKYARQMHVLMDGAFEKQEASNI